MKVTKGNGCVFCDIDLAPTRGFHLLPDGRSLRCPIVDEPPLSGRKAEALPHGGRDSVANGSET